MTIVIQHWFDELLVTDEGFTITLNFSDQPERMYVPYDAIRTFVDPSVEFGLKFENQDGEDGNKATPPPPVEIVKKPNALKKITESLTKGVMEKSTGKANKGKSKAKDIPDKPTEKKEADVVSLDAFRK